LVGKPKGKRPLKIPRRRWENNIRMDFKKIGREVVNWMHLTQDRVQWRALVNTAMKKGGKFLDQLSDC
jgi:hypothetical protein